MTEPAVCRLIRVYEADSNSLAKTTLSLHVFSFSGVQRFEELLLLYVSLDYLRYNKDGLEFGNYYISGSSVVTNR